MKRLLALGAAAMALLAYLPAEAQAANDTLTLTLTTAATAPCTTGCSKTINGPVGVNVLPLIVSTYQSACNTSINGTCTVAQVLNYWVTLVGKNLTTDIQNAQTAAAVASAQATVTPVPVQ